MQDQFIEAAKEGNLEQVKDFVKQGIDVNEYGTKRSSALYIASARRHKEVVSYLLSQGALVETPNNYGYTPLMAAAENGWQDIVQVLIAKGADVNARTYIGRGILAIDKAAKPGHINVVRYLIENGSDVGYSAFRGAIMGGHKDVVEVLLAHRVDTNPGTYTFQPYEAQPPQHGGMTFSPGRTRQTPQKGQSLLEVALRAGEQEIALLLIEDGAPVDEKNYSKTDTASPLLVLALKKGLLKVAMALVEKGAGINEYKDDLPIISYLIKLKKRSKRDTDKKRSKRDIDKITAGIQFLCENGADLEKRPLRRIGFTPLLLAASYADKEIAELLLAHGADIHAKNLDPPGYSSSEQGATALILACKSKDREIVEFLLKKGADPNQGDASDHTPIYFVCRFGYSVELLRLLLDHGGNPNQTWKDGSMFAKNYVSPLRLALRSRSIDMAHLLLENKADIRAESMAGMIVESMVKKNDEAMRFLVEQGADIDDVKGFDRARRLSPLMYAAEHENVDHLHYLLENNARINLQNESGDTALIKAVSAAKLRSVQFLLQHGADCNIHNNEGNTALAVAADKNSVKIAEELLAASADVNSENHHGITPYYYAKSNRNRMMIKLLKKHGADSSGYTAYALKVKALKASGFIPSDARTSSTEINPKKLEMFEALMAERLGRNNLDDYSPDPLLSSPEATWKLHKKALLEGNLGLFRKTIADKKHPLIQIFTSLKTSKRIQLASEMRPIEKVSQEESKAVYRIRKKIQGDEITSYIKFVKLYGEWKIVDY